MSTDAFYGDLSKEIDFVNPESGQEVQNVAASATRGRQAVEKQLSVNEPS